MDPLSAWRAVRAARWFVLGAIVLGAVLGALPRPAVVHGRATTLAEVAGGGWGHDEASAVVGVPPTASGADAASRIAQAAFYAGSSAVRDQTAAALKLPAATANDLSGLLRLTVSSSAGQATITGLGTTPQQAADLANAYATALVAQVASLRTAATVAGVTAARQQVADVEAQIAATSAQLAALGKAASGDSAGAITLRNQLAALQGTYQAAYSAYEAAQTTAPTGPALIVSLQAASPSAAAYVAPTASITGTRWARGVAGAVVGLVLGLFAALAWELRRPRLRTRQAVEDALGAPVIVELPATDGTPADAAVRVAPTSRTAEAYRTLHTVLVESAAARSAERHAVERAAVADGHGRGARGGVVDLTSPNGHAVNGYAVNGHGPHGATEGTARLDALDARVGTNGSGPVDRAFRTAFHVTSGSHVAVPGPSSNGHGPVPPASRPAFEWWGAPIVLFAPVDDETSVPAIVGNVAAAAAEAGRRAIVVRVAPAGQSVVVPAADVPAPRSTGVPNVWVVELDARGRSQLAIKAALRRLAGRADVLLVEMGSVLAEHTGAVLGPLVDLTVVVADAGHTRAGAATEAAGRLRRLGVPVRGVVLADVPARELSGGHTTRRGSLRLPAANRG